MLYIRFSTSIKSADLNIIRHITVKFDEIVHKVAASMEHYSGSTDPAVASLDSSARVLLTTVTHKLLPALTSAKAAVDQEGSSASVNWADALVRPLNQMYNCHLIYLTTLY